MQFSLQAWKKKRKLSMLVYLLWGITFGIDYSVIIVTLLQYLKNLVKVKTEHEQFYYGFCVCVYYAVGSISAVIITRIVDRTRKVKLAMSICIVFAVIGNLIYSVYLSPVFLLIGRALVGINDAVGSIVVGEIIRIYEDKEGTQAQWWFIAACSIGYSTGSWITLCFTNINVTIYSSTTNSTLVNLSESVVVLNRYNFTGIFLSCLHFITLLVVVFCAHDCSNEYDLKTILHEQQLSEMYVVENKRAINRTIIVGKTSENTAVTDSKGHRSTSIIQSTSDNSIPTEKKLYTIINGLIHQRDALIILVSSFLFSYTAFILDLLIPIIILERYDWSEDLLKINYTIHSVVYFFAILLCSKICTTNKRVYVMNITAIVFTIITLSLLMVMAELKLSKTMKIALLVTFQIAYMPVWFLDEVTQCNLLARIVQSDIQSFAEAFRSSLSKTGCIVASLMIAVKVSEVYLASVLIGLCLVAMGFYLYRAREMINLQISNFQ